MWQEFSLFCYLDEFVAWICLNVHWLLGVMGVMHEADDAYLLNPEHLVVLLAGPISHTSNKYIDFVDFLHFTGFVYHLFYSF